MRTQRALLGTVLALCSLLCVTSNLQAQSDPIFEQGFKPFGTFQGGDIDSVNLLNLELNLHIPIISIPQLGGKLPFGFYIPYLPNLFLPIQFDSDCSLGYCISYYPYQIAESGTGFFGDLGRDFGMYVNRSHDYPYPVSLATHDGAVHSMGVLSVDAAGYAVDPPPIDPYYAPTCPYTDGATDRNGITYQFGCTTSDLSSLYAYYKDPNGNTITESIPGLPSWTDTLGRTINSYPTSTADFSGCTGTLPTYSAGLLSFPGPNGGTETFKYCYALVYINILPDPCGSDYYCLGGTLNYVSQKALQTVILPNNTKWVFQYDSAPDSSTVGYGDLVNITFPTGGSISYTWQTNNVDTGCSASLPHGELPFARVLATRTVDANDGQGGHTWTYYLGGYGASPYSRTTTVQDPAGNQTVHTFSNLALPGIPGGLSCQLYETSTQTYQGSSTSGTLMRTTTTAYIPTESYGSTYPSDRPGFMPSTITTTLEDGEQTQVAMNYQYPVLDWGTNPLTDGNVLTKYEYDYGSGAPGSLLRVTTNTYMDQPSSGYLSRNLLSLLSSVQVQNGYGAVQSYATYGYDDSPSGCTTTPCGNLSALRRYTDNIHHVDTLTTYNSYGLPTSKTDPNGNNTTYTYDYTGAFLSEIDYPPTGSITHIECFSYDLNTGLVNTHTGQNVSSCPSTVDQTLYNYDFMGRPTCVYHPDGGQECFTYSDSATNPSFTYAKKITSGITFVEQGRVDGLGRAIQTITSVPSSTCAAGYSYTDTTYDNVGRKFSVSNPYCSAGDTTYGSTKTYYDVLNRPTVIVPPDGTIPTSGSCPTNDVCMSYSGSCTTISDQAGIARKTCGDALGRMTSVVEDPAGSSYSTSYAYDALGNLTSVVQSGSRNRSFTYDWLSQLHTAFNPESGTVCYGVLSSSTCVWNGYDGNGNPIYKTDARGVQTTFTYDALNRLTNKTYSDGSPAVSYLYDGRSVPAGCSIGSFNFGPYVKPFRTAMCDGAGSEAWSHDPMGRALSDQRTNVATTMTTAYSYNYDGSIYSIGYPGGWTLTYAPNEAAQPKSAIDTGNSINYVTGPTLCPNGQTPDGVCYTPQGTVTSYKNGSSLTTTMYYNSRLQPCRFAVNSSGTAPAGCLDTTNYGNVLDLNYSYDLSSVNTPCSTGYSSPSNNGNVASITNNITSARSQQYCYDPLNRLLSARTNSTYSTSPANCWNERYGYDSGTNWGNLLSIGPDSTLSAYTSCTQESGMSIAVNARNQISSPSNYIYDAAGHLVSAPGPFGNTFSYNAEGEMTQVAGSSDAAYLYDGDGKRVAKTYIGGPLYKLYWYGTGADPLSESDGSGNITDEYIFLGGKRIARRAQPGS